MIRTSATLLALSALALTCAATACSSGNTSAGAPVSSPPASSTSSTAASTPSTTSTPPTTTTTTAGPTTTAPPKRTDAGLAKALIALADLPTGWAVDPASADDAQPTFSAAAAACRDFVALGNAAKAPGSTASADVDVSGGQQGPFVSESLDALGASSATAALLTRVEKANAACHSVTVAIPGTGSSTFAVTPVSPPTSGTHPVAVRISARGGDLDGLELTQVYTGVADTILVMTFIGSDPADIQDATDTAVTKAGQVLAVAAATT